MCRSRTGCTTSAPNRSGPASFHDGPYRRVLRAPLFPPLPCLPPALFCPSFLAGIVADGEEQLLRM